MTVYAIVLSLLRNLVLWGLLSNESTPWLMSGFFEPFQGSPRDQVSTDELYHARHSGTGDYCTSLVLVKTLELISKLR